MSKTYQACETLLYKCANSQPHDKVLIVTDPDSLEVALALWNTAKVFPNRSLVMMPTQETHGQEPTDLVRAAMMEADIIYRVTKFSISNTQARRDACANGARDVNCADYNMRMLESGGLHGDFEALVPLVNETAERLRGDTIEITTGSGSHFTGSIAGREPIAANAFHVAPGQACFPPDVECAIGVINGTGNGVVFIDGSVPHPKLGVLKNPIRVEFVDSKIVGISGGEEAEALKGILAEPGLDSAYYMGEVGIGMNPACQLSGRMLEDEGCYGTMHFGIGDDRSFGGSNACPMHIDLIMYKPTIKIDGQTVMENGEIVPLINCENPRLRQTSGPEKNECS